MRVLFYTHSNAFKSLGGGEIQLLKTKEYLQKYGIDVKLYQSDEDFKDRDIVHFFSLSKDLLPKIRKAKSFGCKIVISPIFWPMIEYALKGELNLAQKIKIIIKYLIDAKFSFFSKSKKMLLLADIILPNSKIEAKIIKEIFDLDWDKFSVVYNAADKRFLKATPTEFLKKFGVENFLLNVGRIEPRKNQLKLLQSIKELELPTVFIGNVADRRYFYLFKKQIDKIKNTKIVFIPFISHESSLLSSAYAAAKTFVLPSWYETPGLSALEAAMAGCNIVITNRGSTREYFRNYVEYIDPSNIRDIRTKIEKSYFSPKNNKLKNFVAKHYTWENTALQTLKAYERVIGK
jgi:glycosyltransferase involved in cell wall biosynthesis